jgi:hypothetical protein
MGIQHCRIRSFQFRSATETNNRRLPNCRGPLAADMFPATGSTNQCRRNAECGPSVLMVAGHRKVDKHFVPLSGTLMARMDPEPERRPGYLSAPARHCLGNPER